MAAWKTRDTHRIREQKLLMGNGRSSHEHKNQNMRQKPHAKPSIFAGRQVAAVTHSMHAACAGHHTRREINVMSTGFTPVCDSLKTYCRSLQGLYCRMPPVPRASGGTGGLWRAC